MMGVLTAVGSVSRAVSPLFITFMYGPVWTTDYFRFSDGISFNSNLDFAGILLSYGAFQTKKCPVKHLKCSHNPILRLLMKINLKQLRTWGAGFLVPYGDQSP